MAWQNVGGFFTRRHAEYEFRTKVGCWNKWKAGVYLTPYIFAVCTLYGTYAENSTASYLILHLIPQFILSSFGFMCIVSTFSSSWLASGFLDWIREEICKNYNNTSSKHARFGNLFDSCSEQVEKNARRILKFFFSALYFSLNKEKNRVYHDNYSTRIRRLLLFFLLNIVAICIPCWLEHGWKINFVSLKKKERRNACPCLKKRQRN